MRSVVPARTPRSLRVLAPGALALALLLAPAPARAEVEVGAAAPEVEAKEFINTEPLALSQLKGRVVFLELFSTT